MNAIDVLENAVAMNCDYSGVDSGPVHCRISTGDLKFALRSQRNDLVKNALESSGDVDGRKRVVEALAQDGVLLQAVDYNRGHQSRVRTILTPTGAIKMALYTSELEIAAKFPQYEFIITTVGMALQGALDRKVSGVSVNPWG